LENVKIAMGRRRPKIKKNILSIIELPLDLFPE